MDQYPTRPGHKNSLIVLILVMLLPVSSVNAIDDYHLQLTVVAYLKIDTMRHLPFRAHNNPAKITNHVKNKQLIDYHTCTICRVSHLVYMDFIGMQMVTPSLNVLDLVISHLEGNFYNTHIFVIMNATMSSSCHIYEFSYQRVMDLCEVSHSGNGSWLGG